MNHDRRLLAAALAAPLAFAGLVAGCNSTGGGEESSTDAAAVTTTTEAEQAPAQGAALTPAGFDAQKIYARVSDGVVTVRSVFGNPNALGGGGGQGSGFVISDQGEVVTNAHVVTDAESTVALDPGQSDQSSEPSAPPKQADEVFVEFSDRNQVPAEIVGVDLNADIALLKVDPDGLKIDPLQLGDSDKAPVGEPVAAIGSPFGQEQSLSIGIISATDRSIDSLTRFSIDGALQTDASINPGNSGGPLIDGEGHVIGVNQQINTTSGGNEGVGFAVPSNVVKRSVDDLRDDGKAEYAFIGVTSVPLYPQLAEKLGIDAPTGSLIVGVSKGSPAAEAGLRGPGDQTIDFQGQEIEVGGDVIVGVDGEKLVDESDLSRIIFSRRPGDEVKLEVIRDGDRRTVQVTLQARPTSSS